MLSVQEVVPVEAPCLIWVARKPGSISRETFWEGDVLIGPYAASSRTWV